MIRLPAKRERVRSGILREVKRVWNTHRAFIRRHTCVVTLGKVHDDCDGPIDPAHYRTAANSGKGLKPHDWWLFPCCRKHHIEQHSIGQPAFERRYGINLAELCREFARLSTDIKMREAMKEADRSTLEE